MVFSFPAQTFSWIDLPFIIILFFIELLLSSDNAAALGVLVRDLPLKQRNKALFTGLISGLLLRALGIIFASYLIRLFWIQVAGGLYLVYIAYNHVKGLNQIGGVTIKKHSFCRVVFLVELTDLLFAIDSILAAFALAALYYPYEVFPHKLWVIYVGGVIGVVMMRFCTTWFIRLIDRHPHLEKVIFFVVGWMGVKLISEGVLHFFPETPWKYFFDFLFWIGTLLIVIIGFLSTKWRRKG
jgi:YkoY family integral membrane protein